MVSVSTALCLAEVTGYKHTLPSDEAAYDTSLHLLLSEGYGSFILIPSRSRLFLEIPCTS
jgi:hypothetical protein